MKRDKWCDTHCKGELICNIMQNILNKARSYTSSSTIYCRGGVVFLFFYTKLTVYTSVVFCFFLSLAITSWETKVQARTTRKAWNLLSPVVPDVLEKVEGLLQTVGLIVLSDHHIVTATGHHKDDGRYIYRWGRKEKIRKRFTSSRANGCDISYGDQEEET